MHEENEDTKLKYVSNGYFLTVLPRALFQTQPKVYGGAYLQI